MKPENKGAKAAGTQGANENPSTPNASFYNTLEKRAIWLCLALIAFASFIVFKDFINFKKIYLFRDIGSDSINIYFPGLTGISDILKQDKAPGWTFEQGMGQNMFPFWLGDYFSNFLEYFDKSKIPYGIALMEILKIFLIGAVFYKFLKEIKLSNFTALIFSILYAFSGFVILGGCWSVFSTEALYIAVILYGFERWLGHRKFFWLIAGITSITLLQPFYLFPYSFFLAAYMITRYLDVNPEADRKTLILFALKTVGLAVLAVFITSYQLFPDILQYIESPRVGGESSLFARLKQQPMFGVADPALRFTTTFRAFSSDMIGTGNNFRGWQNYLEAPLFYCGIFCLIVFPQFFSSLSKRQKIAYGIVTGLFCLPIVFPYFRYLFWAFSGDYFRAFSLVIVLFMVIFSARAITFIERTHKVNKIVLGVTVAILLFFLYSPSAQFKQAIDTDLRGFVTFLIFVYAGLLLLLGTNSPRKNTAKIFIIVLCFFEVIFFSNITVNKRDVITGNMLKEKTGYNDYTVESIAYLNKIDKSFFRVNKEYSSGLAIHGSINDAKVFGFHGTPSYFSFNQKNYIKFLGDLNVIDVRDENSTRWAKGLSERPILFSLASGKYWLSRRPANALAGIGLDSIAKFGDVVVYRNRYALPFGVAYDKIIDESQLKTLSTTQKDFALLRAVVVGDEDRSEFAGLKPFALADTTAPMTFESYAVYRNELRKDSLTVTKFSDNHITGNIAVAVPKALFFSIPFDEGWSAKLDGQDTKLYRLNCGLTGLKLPAGKHAVELSFTPRYKGIGALVSCIAALLFIALLAFTYYKDRSKANLQAQ